MVKLQTDNYNYTFRNSEGFTFTITTYTYNTHFDSSETIFYERGLRSDYTEGVLEYHADEIKEILYKFDLNVDTSDCYYKIYVNGVNEFEPLSDFISKLRARTDRHFEQCALDSPFVKKAL